MYNSAMRRSWWMTALAFLGGIVLVLGGRRGKAIPRSVPSS